MAKNENIYSKLEVSKYALLFFAVFLKKLKVDPQSAGQPKAHTYTKQSLKHVREKRPLLRAMWWMFSLLNMLNPANEY